MGSDFYKNIFSNNDLVAAPLAGYSFLPFRRLLRQFTHGLIFSEMISAEGIMRENPLTIEYLDRCKEDYPLSFQLFGGKADSIANAILVIQDKVEVDAIDINMGCPVKKVLKTGGGSALLGDLPKIRAIAKAARKATNLPLSIKIRLGLDRNNIVFKEIIKIAEDEGIDAISIHARTRADMFGGTVDYEALKQAQELSSIPIIGNGDIFNYSSYLAMKNTGVMGAMIGRAQLSNPWVFKEILDGRDSIIDRSEIGSYLIKLYQYMQEHAEFYPQKKSHYFHTLRKLASAFGKGFENVTAFRINLYKSDNEEEMLKILKDFYRI